MSPWRRWISKLMFNSWIPTRKIKNWRGAGGICHNVYFTACSRQAG